MSDTVPIIEQQIDVKNALLESCKEMLGHLEENDFDVTGTPPGMINRAKSAILKASE